jgi:phosphoglycolate phosphatase-like HAD superfamily hydrolase
MRRLVLFDIDGTLISGGPARAAFHHALLDVFGTAGPIDEWEFSGKTDPQIARELLTEAGLERDRVDEGLPALWERYLAEMEVRLPTCPPEVLPGVRELLDRLVAEGQVALGLLTGNVAGGARLKLSSAGLYSTLSVGAFGSDHEERSELVPIALRRAVEHWGTRFTVEDAVVVGDTPRDVDCGRSHGARTVAVATGRFGVDLLRSAGADGVLETFADTDRAVSQILG